MKLALISDIHGNYKAFEAFLSYIGKIPVDGIICLGDYVTDCPYPQRTMKLLYEMQDTYSCYMVRGNREEYLLRNADNHEGWKPSSANGALYYTLQNMTERDLRFFRCLPVEQELTFKDMPALCLCHGTPGNIRGNMVEDEGLRERVMTELEYPYLLGGHTHFQEIYVQDGKTYINPGSLGFVVGGEGGTAQFAILTGTEGRWEAERLSIPYDLEGFLADFTASGLDEIGMTLNKAVKKSLKTGIDYFYLCVLAMEEEARKLGKKSIAEVPEGIWKTMEEKFEL